MRFELGLCTAAAALTATSVTTGAIQQADPALAFVAVNVLPMTAGAPILRNQTVVVRNGVIAAIGPARAVRVGGKTRRIDGRGKYLMPGLFDMHVHLEHFDNPAYLKLFLVNGVTTVRNMDGRPHILDWKRQASAGTLASPEIHSAGQVLDGSPPVRDDNLALGTPAEARRAVRQQAAAGYEFIKVYVNLAPEVFQAIVKTAAELGLPVVGHKPSAVGLDAFLSSGVKSIEHLGDFGEAIAAPSATGSAAPAVVKRRLGFAAEPSRVNAVAAKVAASGIWVVPTMITDERTLAPQVKIDQWAKSPEVAAVDRGILQYWRGALERAASRLGAGDWGLVEQGKANQRALVGAFHRAGVPLLLGTDTPQPFVFPGASVHDELANYVAGGLTPVEALALATREPARFLGQAPTSGTIERGKRANLLLLDANPLADIGATRRISGIVTAGRWLPADRLRQMRGEVEAVAAASK